MPFDKLQRYVQEVLTLILGEKGIAYELRIAKSKNDLFTHSDIIGFLTHEYLVMVSLENKVSDLAVLVKKLSRFINKDVKWYDNEDITFIYWFEGDEIEPIQLADIQPTETAVINQNTSVRFKSDTRLPVWLDKFIFEKLKACYAPDFEKFGFNLDHSAKDILTYLGTYFPRSYSESYCIFNDVLMNKGFKQDIIKNEIINILDIGCGTGGNLIGLLTALEKNLDKSLSINILAVDGNANSLEILSKIIEKFQLHTDNKIEIKTVLATFENMTQLNTHVQEFIHQSFDFIMSFKAIGEIISNGKSKNSNGYLDFTSFCCPLLTETGLLLVLDVTTKAKNDIYLPILLNEQVRRFTKYNEQFSILSPVSCNFLSHKCTVECFYYHEFTISHHGRTKDVSRVVYKIIGRTAFVKKISKDFKVGKFVINWKLFDQQDELRCYCPYTTNEKLLIDSYKLS